VPRVRSAIPSVSAVASSNRRDTMLRARPAGMFSLAIPASDPCQMALRPHHVTDPRRNQRRPKRCFIRLRPSQQRVHPGRSVKQMSCLTQPADPPLHQRRRQRSKGAWTYGGCSRHARAKLATLPGWHAFDMTSHNEATRPVWKPRRLFHRRLRRARSGLENIGQNTCSTANMKAVLMPNRSMPSAASSAPIISQWCCRISPEAPRVVIESTE
jgi:hypothetical protein